MDMKRRDLFAIGLAAVAVPAMSRQAAAATPGATTYPVGDFMLSHTKNGLSVSHKKNSDRVIWATPSNGDFLAAQEASVQAKEFGSPEGTFEISDTIAARYDSPTIENIEVNGNRATVSGSLIGEAGKVGYAFAFEALSETHIRFVIKLFGAQAPSLNRILLTVDSAKDEAIFGCGSQLTYFNQKGKLIPILVEEHVSDEASRS